MIVDFLLSKDGLRVDHVDLAVEGIRFARVEGRPGLAPHTAARVEGSIRLTLVDLTAAFTRPEIVDQLLAGLSGLARPELRFVADDGDEQGGVRLTGSIEIMGRRFPVSAYTRLTIVDDRIVLSATQLEGVPVLALFTSRLPSLALPLTLPEGLHFTDVRTDDGAVVVGFAGDDVPLGGDAPMPRVDPDPPAVEAAD